jgi:DMSO/TMAO reductase YedYZ molybdopterin-dependent catalytic subunit
MVGLGAIGVAFGRPASEAVSQTVAATVPGLTQVIPATGGFRIYSVVSVDPVIPKADYTLRVDGYVERPTTFTFADLAALPQTQMTKDFQCVTGWRVDDVPWSGVLLRDVLEHVGADTSVAGAMFTSYDGVYTESLKMDQALRDDILIASTMWGKPIRDEHGGPVRLYVAPMYGYKSIKWLSGIQVTDTLRPSYWEMAGYDADAWVGRSNGRTDEPI